VDMAIAAEHKLPVVMVSGDDKTVAEAEEWLPQVVTCETKKGTGWQSADLLPFEVSHLLIRKRTGEALALRKEMPLLHVAYPATLRWDYLPKGSLRTHDPDFKPCKNPRRVEKTGDSVEILLIGK